MSPDKHNRSAEVAGRRWSRGLAGETFMGTEAEEEGDVIIQSGLSLSLRR